MSKPVCPICDSGSVIPDAGNGGAGRNRCLGCGHVAAVRDFHQPKAFAIPRRGKRWVDVQPDPPKKPREPVDRQRRVVHKGPTTEHFWWQDD